jgi:hypothetical protein
MFRAFRSGLGRAVRIAITTSVDAVGVGLARSVKAVTGGKIAFKAFDEVITGIGAKRFRDNGAALKQNAFGGSRGFDPSHMSVLKDSVKNLGDMYSGQVSGRLRKALAGQYWETLRQLRSAKRIAKERGETALQGEIDGLLAELNNKVGRKIATLSNLSTLGPRYIGAVCVDSPAACVGGAVAVAATVTTALAVSNLVKCGRFKAGAGSCNLPPPEEDDTVADALLEMKESERRCFTACMPSNYSGSQDPYPAPPTYNTSALVMQSVQDALAEKDKLTQADRENLEAEDGTRPDHFQPYCTAEVDDGTAGAATRPTGCEAFCLDRCYCIDPVREVVAEAEADDEMIGLVVLVAAGIAAVVLALFLRQRKKHALPDEEEKLLSELKDDL